jgi:DNA-binding transcriptional regulator YhcF (GntR family)
MAEKGVCFPSYRQLPQVSGVRGKTILARALRILEGRGFVEKSQGERCSNTYRLFGGNGSMVELELYPLN